MNELPDPLGYRATMPNHSVRDKTQLLFGGFAQTRASKLMKLRHLSLVIPMKI